MKLTNAVVAALMVLALLAVIGCAFRVDDGPGHAGRAAAAGL